MMMHGWCTECRRFRRIRVRFALIPNHMPMGTCQECEDKQQENRRGRR